MGFFSSLKSAWKQGRQEHEGIRDEIIDFMVLVHNNEPDMILDFKNAFEAMIALEQIFQNKGDYTGSKLVSQAREKFSSITVLYILTEVSKKTGKPVVGEDGRPIK